MLIKSGNLCTTHGIILLRPQNIGYVYEGKVANLVEKWELNKVITAILLMLIIAILQLINLLQK